MAHDPNNQHPNGPPLSKPLGKPMQNIYPPQQPPAAPPWGAPPPPPLPKPVGGSRLTPTGPGPVPIQPPVPPWRPVPPIGPGQQSGGYVAAGTNVKPVPYTPPREAPTIVIQGLYSHFEKTGFTLSIPDLRIYPGELTYIGGPSGSGKSTLIRMLALETEIERGQLHILDRNVGTLSAHARDDLRGGGITYIPQKGLGLIDILTPVECIRRLLYDFEGIPLDEGARRAEVGLTKARLLRERFEATIKTLSGGEWARVAIGKAYAAERPICLSDEILPALDEESRINTVDLFQDLAAEGYTVVVIAHQPNLMDRFHRVILLENGHIKSDLRYSPLVRGPAPRP